MKIDQKMAVHNRFDIEVRDKDTGMVKQTAVGFNVITNGYFSRLLSNTRGSYYYYPLDYIAFGRGTGTPSVSDTALFSRIDYKTANTVETVYAYPTSHITKRITLDADSYNGETITEVGFEGGGLTSHAMLQDSEGQQIAIHKTDTDVVYINATFFCSYTPSGFGDNGIYPTPGNNILIKWVFGEALRGCGDTISLRAWHHPLKASSDMGRYYTFTKDFRVWSYSSAKGIGYGDYAAKTLTLEAASILSAEGGTQALKTIGFNGIGAFVFPDPSVMNRYEVRGKTLGNGDGVEKDFDLGAPFIKPGTVHIYIDDVEQTEGVDYEVDLDSNGTDNLGNYHTAGMSLIYDREHVVWGDEAARSKTTGSSYYDPICMTKSLSGRDLIPSSCYVTQDSPIWIDFSEPKKCNTLKFVGLTLPSGKEDGLVIEYSEDNESWTAAAYSRAGQVYSFEEAAARYWRVYIAGYSWSYSFYGNSGTRDGVDGVYASFFLGRTKPALRFVNAPANGAVITASYDLDVPYKTENNLIRIMVVISLNRD